MKIQIIETPDYILAVSDEEIKENDYIFNNFAKINLVQKVRKCDFDSSHYKNGNWKKIIAHQPKSNVPELDLPLLPEIVIEPRGFDEFEYSEEDLRKAIQYAYNKGVLEIDISIDDIIQSLKQPKWFVAEKEYLSNTGEWKPVLLPSEWEIDTQVRLKTTTINDKTYLIGKFTY